MTMDVDDGAALVAGPTAALRLLGGDGPDILLIHGFGSDRMSWLANAPALQARYRVWAVDLPGHGANLDAGDGRLETLAGAVEAAIDRQERKPFVLIGHSLGGGIAMLVAARRPDLVGALVLIAPLGLGEGVDTAFLQTFPALADAHETEALLQRLVVRPRLINRQLVAHVEKQLAAPGARAALSRIAAALMAGDGAVEAAIDTVRQRSLPRLTVWGEADRINPLARQRLEAFGGATMVLPETGHLPHVEAAAAFNAAVLAFPPQQVGAA